MKRSLLTLCSAAALLLPGWPAAALAAAPAGAAHRACLAQATPAGHRAPAVITCYATFAQSISAATGGRVRLPADTAPGSVSPDQIDAGAAPDATVVIAIDFQNVNFSGASLTWTEAAKCGSFQAASMPAGWNDVISSVEAFSGCATTLYQNNNFGGATFSVAKNGAAASLGSFNDKASSQKWCTAAPCG
ncbi:MAG TPA: hypothetical protein VH637_13270 [Streptosporangiaceae bacterium]